MVMPSLPPPPVFPGLPQVYPGIAGYSPRISYDLDALRVVGGLPPAGFPFDLALIADEAGPRRVPAYRFHVLGNLPSDPYAGFRLSGPSGWVIRAASQKYPGLSPQALGLPAFVGAMTSQGPRLLTRTEFTVALQAPWGA